MVALSRSVEGARQQGRVRIALDRQSQKVFERDPGARETSHAGQHVTPEEMPHLGIEKMRSGEQGSADVVLRDLADRHACGQQPVTDYRSIDHQDQGSGPRSLRMVTAGSSSSSTGSCCRMRSSTSSREGRVRDPGDLAQQILRQAHAGLGRADLERLVHVVGDVADLDHLGHAQHANMRLACQAIRRQGEVDRRRSRPADRPLTPSPEPNTRGEFDEVVAAAVDVDARELKPVCSTPPPHPRGLPRPAGTRPDCSRPGEAGEPRWSRSITSSPSRKSLMVSPRSLQLAVLEAVVARDHR